jgi:linoleoyl-CoA desaturase
LNVEFQIFTAHHQAFERYICTFNQNLSMVKPKFPAGSDPFFIELKHRVNAYFTEKGIQSTGNFSLYLKSIIMLPAFVLIYVHLVFFTPPNGLAIFECILLGSLVAGIGFNIMHDGAHGSYSGNKLLNSFAAYTLNVLGGSAFMWNIKHNVVHHAYTNIDGVDSDLEFKPLLRMCPSQKKLGIHKYQHIYVWFLYCLLYVFWIFVTDYKKYFSRNVGPVHIKKMTISEHIQFWSFKAFHYTMIFVLPIAYLGFWHAIIGYVLFAFTAGFVLSIVFQLAHIVEETSFPEINTTTGRMDDSWAVHQLKTTANFATKSRAISWFVGGLNFQVEHHLFPKISHVHYPAINKIVKRTCKEFGVEYHEYPNLVTALSSHATFLRAVGHAA